MLRSSSFDGFRIKPTLCGISQYVTQIIFPRFHLIAFSDVVTGIIDRVRDCGASVSIYSAGFDDEPPLVFGALSVA